MAATPSIRLEITSTFKGGLRVWSNRYHFNGGTPADAGHWATLVTNLVGSFETCITSDHEITGAVGYAAGSDVPVYSTVLTNHGTLTAAGGDDKCPLEVAALIRWSTAARSTKNHPIYAFSYIHGALYASATAGNDKLAADQASALATYATHWVTGFSDGTLTLVRATPSGHAATGSIVEEWLTHRDFPYRSSV